MKLLVESSFNQPVVLGSKADLTVFGGPPLYACPNDHDEHELQEMF